MAGALYYSPPPKKFVREFLSSFSQMACFYTHSGVIARKRHCRNGIVETASLENDINTGIINNSHIPHTQLYTSRRNRRHSYCHGHYYNCRHSHYRKHSSTICCCRSRCQKYPPTTRRPNILVFRRASYG